MLGKYALSKGDVMVLAESPLLTETKLKRITTLSAANAEMVFTHVIHHFNEDSLTRCFHELDGKKAIGSDGVDKKMYAENLEENIKDLVRRMKRMAYIPGSVREVLIPKEGNPKATRPLGISNFEDKIVQKMMQKVLESIYEPLFSEASYGFRPNRGCHDAIKALDKYLYSNEIETVIDVDLSNFFGSINHRKILEIIKGKIRDPRLMRYLERMFKAGVLKDGDLVISDEGVPQGSICSPIISNIFAHEVIDKWIENTVKPHCAGKVKVIRYADDVVICCQYNHDAERIKIALKNRLAKYELRMNEDKTKLIKFSKRKQQEGESQETFAFLGFTFYLGKSRKGNYLVKIRTEGKRIRSKLKKVKEWVRLIRNKLTLKEIMKIAAVKMKGHIQYYGVSHNFALVEIFILRVTQILFKWLNRRSQRRSFTWEQFRKYLDKENFPRAKICHKLF